MLILILYVRRYNPSTLFKFIWKAIWTVGWFETNYWKIFWALISTNMVCDLIFDPSGWLILTNYGYDLTLDLMLYVLMEKSPQWGWYRLNALVIWAPFFSAATPRFSMLFPVFTCENNIISYKNFLGTIKIDWWLLTSASKYWRVDGSLRSRFSLSREQTDNY